MEMRRPRRVTIPDHHKSAHTQGLMFLAARLRNQPCHTLEIEQLSAGIRLDGGPVWPEGIYSGIPSGGFRGDSEKPQIQLKKGGQPVPCKQLDSQYRPFSSREFRDFFGSLVEMSSRKVQAQNFGPGHNGKPQKPIQRASRIRNPRSRLGRAVLSRRKNYGSVGKLAEISSREVKALKNFAALKDDLPGMLCVDVTKLSSTAVPPGGYPSSWSGGFDTWLSEISVPGLCFFDI
ncbi:hypothetical protein BS47DRAFT_1365428 [Hydnum rufescens UP504]|uniref:Uncharacterized protein n=1 Tax=Hydnum rufescens UP504 TaxID=1448309 RepID=A0A9P6APH5_9AGAM|nr:hypothetical protein BS47DRAFT_1365428 [Hydnum rufescens UP504]